VTRAELVKIGVLCFLIALPWTYVVLDVLGYVKDRRR
jgi:hypothetical protein